MFVRGLKIAFLVSIATALFAGCLLPPQDAVCSPTEFGCNVGAACTTTFGYPECGSEQGYICECTTPIDFECAGEIGTLTDSCVVIG